jgi:hypothetical protein
MPLFREQLGSQTEVPRQIDGPETVDNRRGRRYAFFLSKTKIVFFLSTWR